MNPRTLEALAALDPADRAVALAFLDGFRRDVADIGLRLVLQWLDRSKAGPVSPGVIEGFRLLTVFLRGLP